MSRPLVSFVVPCYKLAHFLRACVDSILNQTYRNLEILILDDFSPDDTPVAAAYNDERVRHIRNERNLGHLRNYNKGISLASGDYIWLISADDRLRTPDAVERCVSLMEGNRSLAYVFSPAVALSDSGQEAGIVEWTQPFLQDMMIEGRRFLRTLARGNCVSAPSCMVRRRCYDAAGMFPLDLPHAGDWYLWCAFAFHGDVAYLVDPIANYRIHSANMSGQLRGSKQRVVWEDQNEVRWRAKGMSDQAGYREVSNILAERLAARYAMDIANAAPPLVLGVVLESIDRLLGEHARSSEREEMRALIYVAVGDQLMSVGDRSNAAFFYKEAWRLNPGWIACTAKLTLSKMGALGVLLRSIIGRFRRRILVRDKFS